MNNKVKINKNIILGTCLLIFWYSMTLSFSSDPGWKSDEKSGFLLNFVVSLISSVSDRTIDMDLLHTLIRKAAHMFNYMIIGMLVFNLFMRLNLKNVYVKCLGCVFVLASADEFYQTFVPGRSGRITDVLIDVGGTLIGLMILRGCFWVTSNKSKLFGKKRR